MPDINAIESLNSVIRKAIKKRKLFPTDDSAKKVVYLAIQQASRKWVVFKIPCHFFKIYQKEMIHERFNQFRHGGCHQGAARR